MRRPLRIRWAVGVLAITAASVFGCAVVSRAQDRGQEGASSVARPGALPPPSGVQILTPTDGVDFSSYLNTLTRDVRNKWYASMPETALKGEKGEATIRFRIESSGKVEDVWFERTSGKDVLDRAAMQAIRDASPFHPLPVAFKRSSITVRFVFYYNVRPPSPTDAVAADCDVVPSATYKEAPFDRLEVLGFVSHNFDVAYAEKIICQRGIDFSPDAAMLDSFRIYNVKPALVATIGKLNPKTISIPSPDRDRAYKSLTLALSDVREGQPQAADVDYKRTLQWADGSASLHLSYAGYLLLTQKQYQEAERQARRSLEIWPNNAEAYVVLAAALATAGRDAEAVPEAREALRIDPEHTSALVMLGASLARSGQYAEAIPVLRKAVLLPLNLPVIHKHLGGCLVHTRDFDGAIKELMTFLDTNPNDAEAHYFLGVAFREKGKESEADIQFREATRIDPANPLYSAVGDRTDSPEAATGDSSSTGPKPEDGVVSGNNYTNTFFGFSYEFPRRWVVLEAETSKAIARISGSILTNGDPVLADVAEVAARNMHSLLFVGKESTKGISSSFNSIKIAALDKRFAPDNKSGEEFAKAMAAAWQHRSQALSVIGTPERFDVAGKTFWKVKFDMSMDNRVAHCIEAVTIEKDYVLLFIFASADASKLNDLVGTLVSVRFTAESPKRPN
jgi:TonB family protein